MVQRMGKGWVVGCIKKESWEWPGMFRDSGLMSFSQAMVMRRNMK